MEVIMQKEMYLRLENYMISCMNDGAHDCQHIYRVLYNALDIANDNIVDKDVLIAASLLHDIGREAQFRNPELDHAIVGADMAYEFLLYIKWPENKARHVKACISTHRFRNSNPPLSMEAQILFDSDKLDVTGALGIARTLAYKGIVEEPLYYVDEDGKVLEGKDDEKPSFFQEYNWKLSRIYDKFFTGRAKAIAEGRRRASADFYKNMYNEVYSTHKNGIQLLKKELE
jgi:uncharacterized protein